jgi:hypothetical protein
MLGVLGKRAVPVVAIMFLLAGCKTNDPVIDAASTTVAPSSTAVAESSTTTSEATTTTTKGRFFSTSTDPETTTTEKKATTTTSSKTTTSRRSTSTSAAVLDYTDAMKKNFIDSCVRTSGGQTSYCECTWDEITTTIPFARFREIEEAIKNGATIDEFPEFTAAVEACK